jgi:hypothetical protein
VPTNGGWLLHNSVERLHVLLLQLLLLLAPLLLCLLARGPPRPGSIHGGSISVGGSSSGSSLAVWGRFLRRTTLLASGLQQAAAAATHKVLNMSATKQA